MIIFHYSMNLLQDKQTCAKKNCICISATRRPIQLRTPIPNGKHAWLCVIRLRPFCLNHLSG